MTREDDAKVATMLGWTIYSRAALAVAESEKNE